MPTPSRNPKRLVQLGRSTISPSVWERNHVRGARHYDATLQQIRRSTPAKQTTTRTGASRLSLLAKSASSGLLGMHSHTRSKFARQVSALGSPLPSYNTRVAAQQALNKKARMLRASQAKLARPTSTSAFLMPAPAQVARPGVGTTLYSTLLGSSAVWACKGAAKNKHAADITVEAVLSEKEPPVAAVYSPPPSTAPQYSDGHVLDKGNGAGAQTVLPPPGVGSGGSSGGASDVHAAQKAANRSGEPSCTEQVTTVWFSKSGYLVGTPSNSQLQLDARSSAKWLLGVVIDTNAAAAPAQLRTLVNMFATVALQQFRDVFHLQPTHATLSTRWSFKTGCSYVPGIHFGGTPAAAAFVEIHMSPSALTRVTAEVKAGTALVCVFVETNRPLCLRGVPEIRSCAAVHLAQVVGVAPDRFYVRFLASSNFYTPKHRRTRTQTAKEKSVHELGTGNSAPLIMGSRCPISTGPISSPSAGATPQDGVPGRKLEPYAKPWKRSQQINSKREVVDDGKRRISALSTGSNLQGWS